MFVFVAMFCESFQGVSIKVWQIWQIQILLLRTMVTSNHGWEPANKNHPPPVWFQRGHQRMVLAAAVRLRSTLDREVGFHHLQTEMGMVMSVGGDGDDM